MTYSIRPATEYDIGDMYNISRAAHRLEDYGNFIPRTNVERFLNYYRWSKRRRASYVRKMTQLLQSTNSVVLVATKGKALLGYTVALYDSPETLRLKGLFVRPPYQGQGIGKALFKASQEGVKAGATISLEVLKENKRARYLYEKEGFQVAGQAQKRFFGAPLITMTRRIIDKT